MGILVYNLLDIMPFSQLENYPVIKCADGEKIICVQRQHPISLINSSIFLVVILLTLISILVLLYSVSDYSFLILNNPIFIIYVSLALVCSFMVLEIHIFLHWYYHLYIITNRALIDRFSFRLSGPYSEVVFGEKLHVQEIIRKPINIFYDFLGIQDVYVYFHQLEKEEPFIFRTPKNAQQIEDIIDNLALAQKTKANSEVPN